jgi:tetratricopeptide (TPR) repeat protein
MLGRERSRSQSSKAARASRRLLAIALSGAALIVGASHTVTLCAVAVVVAASVVVGWWGAHPMKVRPAATALLVAGIGLAAYTALQCVPWPIGWLAAFAPHNADVWSRALTPLREAGPAWAPLTMDPPGSRIELLKGVVYLLVFVAALRVAQRRDGAAFLSGVVIVTGLLLAFAAVLHPAFGMHKLYGIYDPGPSVGDAHVAPLMNPNNLAGYINLAFCSSLASVWSREPRVPRALTGAATLLLAGTQVWVASRGGVIAMILGAATVTGIVLSERARRVDPRVWLTVGCGAATLIGGLFIVLGSLDRAQNELFTTDVTKFSVMRDVAKMLGAYGVFGAGRGAFETTFPEFRSGTTYLRHVSPENFVAQWVTEWGLPIGLLGLAAIVIALRPTAAVARSRTAAGAWAALAAIAVQNLADFGTEVPGVMLSVTACAAIVVGGSPGLAPRWRFERWSERPRAVAKVAIAATLLAGVGAAASVGRHVVDDRRHLHDVALAPSTSLGVMHDLERTAMLRHPAEPYLPFIAALRATRARDESPLPWLEATLERARVYGTAHLLLARVFGLRAPSQARLEYRLALEQAPELAGAVIQESPRLVARFDDAMELVSAGEAGVGMLSSLATSLTPRLPSTCVRLDEELSSRLPSEASPLLRGAASAVADLSGGDDTSWCLGSARSVCIERALSAAGRVETADPASCAGYVLEARALAAAGSSGRAMARLDEVSDRVRDRIACLRATVSLANDVRDDTRLEKALAEIVRVGCVDDRQCVPNLVWVAQEHESRGSMPRALAVYKRAHDAAPDDDALLENVARLAAAAGMNAEALQDYQELARHHPADVRWQRAAQEQRDAIARAAVKL